MRKFIVILILLFSCSKDNKNQINTEELVISVNEAFSDISPFQNHSTYSAFVQAIIFDTLVRVNSKNHISPGICSSLEQIVDTSEWKCTLTNNIKYHDGTAFKAEDILYSFNIHKTQSSPFKSVIDNIKNIEISPDKKEVYFHLKRPDHIFLPSLNAIYIVSPEIFDESGMPRNKNSIIGTGPYKLLSMNQNTISLRRNPTYHRGVPKIDHIYFNYYSDNSIALKELIESKVKLQAFFDFKNEDILSNIDYIQNVNSSDPILFGIFFNMANPSLKNRDVRVALNLLIDRESILSKSGLAKHAKIAKSITRPNSTYFMGNDIADFRYDPVIATELLNKHGWTIKNGYFEKNGTQLNLQLLISEGSYISENATKQIIKYIEAAGVKITVKRLSMKELVAKIITEKNFDLMLSSYASDYDFLTSYLTWYESPKSQLNFSSYDNSEAIMALDEARFAKDDTVFLEKYGHFQKILHDDPPMLYLFWYNYPIYYNKDLKGISSDLFNNISSLKDAWISNETH